MESMDRERDSYVQNPKRLFDTSINLERSIHDARAASLVLEDMLVRRLEGNSGPNGYLNLVLSPDEVAALIYGLYNVGDRIKAVETAWDANFEAMKAARGEADHG